LALARGELDAALQRSARALELAGQVYPPPGPERAALLDHHGIILTLMARFDDAANAIGEAISILEARDPEGASAALAAAHNNLALALDNAERDAEAEPHMVRALELARRLFGGNDPRVASPVAYVRNQFRSSRHFD